MKKTHTKINTDTNIQIPTTTTKYFDFNPTVADKLLQTIKALIASDLKQEKNAKEKEHQNKKTEHQEQKFDPQRKRHIHHQIGRSLSSQKIT